jgi:hypothetical protein
MPALISSSPTIIICPLDLFPIQHFTIALLIFLGIRITSTFLTILEFIKAAIIHTQH